MEVLTAEELHARALPIAGCDREAPLEFGLGVRYRRSDAAETFGQAEPERELDLTIGRGQHAQRAAIERRSLDERELRARTLGRAGEPGQRAWGVIRLFKMTADRRGKLIGPIGM